MKKKIFVLGLMVLLKSVYLYGGNKIEGKWYSEQRNNEGIGTVISFEKDKTF